MWTTEEQLNILPNIYAKLNYKDGILQFYQLYPMQDYLLHVPSGDSIQLDEEGNPILNENGEKVIVPYLSEGGATALKNYNFEINPLGFEAIIKEAE